MALTVRSKRRQITEQAFRDRECERCDQEAQDSMIGVACCQVFDDRKRICEDSEVSALLVSADASSMENLCSSFQDCCHAAVKEERSSGPEEQTSGKKRRSSSWSGLAMPRLCGEKNVSAASDACKKLGFVVTRKMRALSLDDNLHASRMKLLSSRDDSCLPLVAADCSISQLKNDLAALSNPSSRHHKLNIDDQRSQSFDSRRYDLVGSPGPKFLLVNRAAAREEQGESSFKCSASVPFKWEEAPGKPKPSVEKPDPSLQLPPRLSRSATLHKSAISSSFSQRRAQSVNHRQGMLLAAVPVAVDGKQVDPGVQRSTAGTVDGKPIDPSSPTSILCGPEQSSTSCSASSSDTVSDSAVVSDAESGTTTNVANPGVALEDCFKGSAAKRVTFARSIEKILHPDQWLRSKRKKFRGSQDVEMWAPTLAAYFHSIEGSEIAKDESVSVPSSGQIVLLQSAEEEEEAESDKVLKLESGDLGREGGFEESAAGGAMYCGCASPRLAPSRFRLMRSGSSSGQRRWMVTRIRRSSRLLQMFVFKAVRCAVQPRRKSPLESSKLVYQTVKN